VHFREHTIAPFAGQKRLFAAQLMERKVIAH
jgi:hypothetical protein